MARPRRGILDPFWRMFYLGPKTMEAMDALRDPMLPYYKAPFGRGLQHYHETDASRRYYYNPEPSSYVEWHRWCLCEMLYGFFSSGCTWRSQEKESTYGWLLSQDPGGVSGLFESVESDYNLGESWNEHCVEIWEGRDPVDPKAAKTMPPWWLTKGVYPTQGLVEMPAIGGPRRLEQPVFTIGTIGFRLEIPDGSKVDTGWQMIADKVNREFGRDVTAGALKTEYCRQQAAQAEWLAHFKASFDAWQTERNQQIEAIKSRAVT